MYTESVEQVEQVDVAAHRHADPPTLVAVGARPALAVGGAAHNRRAPGRRLSLGGRQQAQQADDQRGAAAAGS